MKPSQELPSRNQIRAWGLPLLAKELIEQAVARRTYVVRSIYALLLFAGSSLLFWGRFASATGPFDLLGQGRDMFLMLVNLQLIGILLCTPALTCGAITSEKERNTFGLLLLTRLGPWTILLEKYLGRLITVGSYLLLSLPLLGFCYCFGGLEQGELWVGLCALGVTVVQVTSIGICCSAYCRTTVTSFLMTCVVTFGLLFGSAVLDTAVGLNPLAPLAEMFQSVCQGAMLAYRPTLISIGTTLGLTGFVEELSLQTPLELGGSERALLLFAPSSSLQNAALIGRPLWQRFVLCLPALLTASVFLLLARFWIVRRAFVPASNRLMRLFHALDHLFYRLNQNPYTRGIILVNDSATLPGDEPIAWRETSKKALGTVRYLVRVLIALQFPTLLICLWTVIYSGDNLYNYRDLHPSIVMVTSIAWALALLFVSVKAATLISSEHAHETLSVLLSTPLRSEDIIQQKFIGVVRLTFVVAAPLITAIVMQGWYGTVTRGLFGPDADIPSFLNWNRAESMWLVLGVWIGILAVATWGIHRLLALDWFPAAIGVMVGQYMILWSVATSISFSGWIGSGSWNDGVIDAHHLPPIVYLLLALSSVLTYLPLAAWVSFSIGLWMRTQTRAIFASLGVLVAWCVLPIVGFVFLVQSLLPGLPFAPIGGTWICLLLLLSPATFPFFMEMNSLWESVGDSLWTFSLLNYTFYGGLTLWLRRRAVLRAPRLLGRLHTPPASRPQFLPAAQTPVHQLASGEHF